MHIKRIKTLAMCFLISSSFSSSIFANQINYTNENLEEVKPPKKEENVSQETTKDYITRFEFITLINETFGFSQSTNINFKDVEKNSEYYSEISKAINAGYISGYEDNTFKPNNFITRQEVCAVISNLLEDNDKEIDKIIKLNDYEKISDWAKASVEFAVEKGYMVGYPDNTFLPNQNLTKNEANILVERFQKSIKQDKTVLIEKENYELAKYEPESGTYLGAYVLQDELIGKSMQKFEEVTGKKHASYFKYFGYKESDLKEFEDWLYEVKSHGAVPHVALEPNSGLDKVVNDEYLENFAKMLGKLDEPIFLRYASEMNGDWVAWHGNPTEYIQKWKMVHDVMEKYAPKVIMVWTPFTFPQNEIMKYYPGDEYVDWVGVNVYNVVYHNNDINQVATDEDPLELLDFVYDTFSHKKPIQISEYGATHYTITDNKYYVDFAVEKISRMYNGILEKYPRIKSIFYFDVNNLVNAPEGRKINNYAITDEPKITNTYKNIISDERYLEKVDSVNKEGNIDSEMFTLKEKSVEIKGETYIDLYDIEFILGGEVTKHKDFVEYKLNDKVYKFNYAKISDSKCFVKLNDLTSKLNFLATTNEGTIIIEKIN